MGTRNLTIVRNKEGIIRVAQYGQWDGYPGGQGMTALSFIKNKDNLAQLERAIENCRFYNRVKDIDNWIEKYESRCPRWDEKTNRMLPDNRLKEDINWFNYFNTRDLGAGILVNICEALKAKETMHDELNIPKEHNGYFYLFDNLEFGQDSLMCEWAYMIDFKDNKFRVFEGFNTDKSKEYELFKTNQEEVDKRFDYTDSRYYGLRLSKEYSLKKLPSYKRFIEDFKSEENE